MLAQDSIYEKLKQEVELEEIEGRVSRDRPWAFSILACLACILAMTTGALFVMVVGQKPCSCPASDKSSAVQEPYSPAAGQIRFVNKYLTDDPDSSKFMGKPRPEVDEAWHKLLEGTMIRVSEEELANIDNATSVTYEKGGYVAGLGISHSLHCLKRVKQFMHPDYYYPGDNQDWDELSNHAEHCLESIRQALLCQPDISLYLMEWTPHSRFKPSVRVPQPHVCVDWPRLHGWMIGRGAEWDYMTPAPAELYEEEDSTRRLEGEERAAKL